MDTFNANVFGGFINDKPKLLHLETHTFKVNIKNPDGSAFDLSGFVTAECAVNNSFDHNYNELMAYAGSTAAVITDAAGGEIEITLDCNTLKFGEVVTYDSNICWFEVNCFDSEAKMTRVLLDRVPCMPHVRDSEGAPSSGDPRYLNETEVRTLIAGAKAEKLVPITGSTFTPETNVYYTQVAAAGDINYTFSFGTAPVTFEFWITKTATGAWNFATASGIDCWWEKDGLFAPENPPPEMTETAMVYNLTFRWDGSALLGNLAYAKAVTA